VTNAVTRQIHTIGYSPHTLDSFIRVLREHEITAVADVRSCPVSRYKPEFDRESLGVALVDHGIKYVFLGDQCGARPSEARCYVDGIVSFDILQREPSFRRGLERIREGAIRYRVALMCAEKDPISCHRMILISHQLSAAFGIDARHILADGTCEENSHAEERLLRLLDLDCGEFPGVGRSYEQRLAEAYKKQAGLIAYREHEEKQDIAEARHG